MMSEAPELQEWQTEDATFVTHGEGHWVGEEVREIVEHEEPAAEIDAIEAEEVDEHELNFCPDVAADLVDAKQHSLEISELPLVPSSLPPPPPLRPPSAGAERRWPPFSPAMLASGRSRLIAQEILRLAQIEAGLDRPSRIRLPGLTGAERRWPPLSTAMLASGRRFLIAQENLRVAQIAEGLDRPSWIRLPGLTIGETIRLGYQ
jgi:hypothetical protein